MKLTFTAAMRARDVSRPRAEHLAAAEAAEPGAAGGARARAASVSGDAAKPAPRRGGPETGTNPAGEPGAAAPDGGARRGRPGFPRRRRGSRDGTRRGRGDR
jgi:hypothetical protein